MVNKEKPAGAMAIWAMGLILGPVIGPVAGGFLAEAEGWRWVFWAIATAARPFETETGVVIIGTGLANRESYALVLLKRKAACLRKETGNPDLRSIYDTTRSPLEVFCSALARPVKLLFMSPIVFLLALFAPVTYGYLYLMFTTITTIFEEQYGFSPGLAGLAYLGYGVGCLLSLVVCGRVANGVAVTHTAGGCFTSESRLPPMIYSAVGPGWGNSLLAFIALALCGPLLFARYGAAIRTHPRFQVRL